MINEKVSFTEELIEYVDRLQSAAVLDHLLSRLNVENINWVEQWWDDEEKCAIMLKACEEYSRGSNPVLSSRLRMIYDRLQEKK